MQQELVACRVMCLACETPDTRGRGDTPIHSILTPVTRVKTLAGSLASQTLYLTSGRIRVWCNLFCLVSKFPFPYAMTSQLNLGWAGLVIIL